MERLNDQKWPLRDQIPDVLLRSWSSPLAQGEQHQVGRVRQNVVRKKNVWCFFWLSCCLRHCMFLFVALDFFGLETLQKWTLSWLQFIKVNLPPSFSSWKLLELSWNLEAKITTPVFSACCDEPSNSHHGFRGRRVTGVLLPGRQDN